MTVLRYQYPKWPRERDATQVDVPGMFDFDLREALNVLMDKQKQIERFSHHYGMTSGDKASALARNIDLLEKKRDTNVVIVWHHPTRDWPIEKLEKAQAKWENDSLKLLFGTAQSPLQKSLSETFGINLIEEEISEDSEKAYEKPTFLEDIDFGNCLVPLIYSQVYLQVVCSLCEMTYLPQQCEVAGWHIPGLRGKKLV